VTFELGVNYWPRRSAMYMWRELDIGEVREEMAQIAAIGFDVVRVFTLAQDFLPKRLCVAGDMVANLVKVVRAAKDAGLKVVPTLVVINMSGKFWWPEWMLDAQGRPADLFSDPTLLRSQSMLVETCARALAGEGSIRAFDLANEIDDAQHPPTRDAAWLWASLLANTIRRVAPGTPIQIGAHLPSLTDENRMRVDDIGVVADEDLMHAYPLYYKGARSFLDTELVPFSCALTAGLAATGRRPLMQEFGMCTAPPGSPGQTITDDFLGQPVNQYLASEEEAATYYETVLQGLVSTGAAGAYAWCYGDYDSRLFGRAPLATAVRERTFGVVRADGSEKTVANVFRKFRQRRDAGTLAQSPVPKVLDVSADEYYRAPGKHFARLYSKWVAQRSS
jgi:endo-1,4-beta-mannosidase